MDSFHEYQDITPQLDYFIQHSTYSNLGCALMTVTPKNELSSRYLTGADPGKILTTRFFLNKKPVYKKPSTRAPKI